MRITIFYSRKKGVFVAKRSDGKVVAEDRNFSCVDEIAHKLSTNVSYIFSSFPKQIREKITGESEEEDVETFKTLFMRIVLSYPSSSPPDEITRKVVRKIIKMRLKLKEISVCNGSINIVAEGERKDIVFEISEKEGKWSLSVR